MDSKGDGKHFFWLVFLACLSSACCGVWPFRIRCPRASFLCLCRLYRLLICYVSDPASQRGCWPQEMFYGFQRWREAFFLACVFGLPELGLLWCLAFSDPLPTSFIFVSVQVIGCLSATFRTQPPKVTGSIFSGLCFWLAWARPVVVFGLFGSVAHELHFCVCAGYRLLICYVSDPASQRGCWPQEMFYGFQRWRKAFFLACVFGLPELGLLWCLAFSDPSGLCFWLAWARPVVVFGLFGSVAHELHFCVCAGYRLLICYVSDPASKGDGKHFFWLVFLACLSSACCGVWPFRIRCPRASFLCLCRL